MDLQDFLEDPHRVLVAIEPAHDDAEARHRAPVTRFQRQRAFDVRDGAAEILFQVIDRGAPVPAFQQFQGRLRVFTAVTRQVPGGHLDAQLRGYDADPSARGNVLEPEGMAERQREREIISPIIRGVYLVTLVLLYAPSVYTRITYHSGGQDLQPTDPFFHTTLYHKLMRCSSTDQVRIGYHDSTVGLSLIERWLSDLRWCCRCYMPASVAALWRHSSRSVTLPSSLKPTTPSPLRSAGHGASSVKTPKVKVPLH